jgi:MFS family permease
VDLNAPQALLPNPWRVTGALAGIAGLRLFGLFAVLPVFALHAEVLAGGDNHLLVGIALGAYGLTQALLQLPFGWLSDRWGRKPLLYLGLAVFALGSFVAAAAETVGWLIAGRALQGAGAVSAVALALLADLTPEDRRARAMVVVGVTIGLTFALSLVAGPALGAWIGVGGIFALTGALALAAALVVAFIVPDPPAAAAPAGRLSGDLAVVLRDAELNRLCAGVFVLHFVLTALFVVVPFMLRDAGLAASSHWMVYLGVVVASFALIVVPVGRAERRARYRPTMLAMIGLLAASLAGLSGAAGSLAAIVVALVAFFTAFTLLEALLPSLVARVAPAGRRGTAVGAYTTVQFGGIFVGGLLGGWLSEHHGPAAVFLFSTLLALAWASIAVAMREPVAVRTRTYDLGAIDASRADGLTRALAALPGVREASVSVAERVATLEVDLTRFTEQHEQHVRNLIEAEA